MKQGRQKTKSPGSQAKSNPLFGKENYRLMLIGLIVLILGFILMPGGKSNNPEVFDTGAIYSFTRITLSPILIIGGLAIEVFAIMKKSKEEIKA